jgi:hypothetical protein
MRPASCVPASGALIRPADIQNLFKTGCSSAFLTHFVVPAGDFNHRRDWTGGITELVKICAPIYRPVEGSLELPALPGLGLALDEGKIEARELVEF